MIDIQTRCLLVMVGAALLGPAASHAGAQSAAPAPTASDSTDSLPHKKHGGLFGKAKTLAGNKLVQSVAKTAACTMVPGGQAIAAAIDASNAKNAGGAAQGTAAAATGTACMPGMGGAASANAAGTSAATAALAGPPQGMMAYGAVQMAAVEQMTAEAQHRMTEAKAQAATGTMTEAPGQLPVLGSDPAAELAKGRTAIRQIDWVAGSSDVSAAPRPAFEEALGKVAQAMRAAGGRYRLDLYMTQRYDDSATRVYGPGRLAAVQQLLAAGGALALEPGKVKRDKDPRLEVVRLK